MDDHRAAAGPSPGGPGRREEGLIPGSLALVLALLGLAGTLWAATRRPRLAPEWLVALAAALLLLAVGAIGLSGARRAVSDLGSTVGFLAALLVLAEGCRRHGVFAALGEQLARRGGERATRLFGSVFAASTVVTVALGLDATVVLLTPVVLVMAARNRTDPKPSAYACGHLANSASLLLPVSNLTNLLAFTATGLTFTRFAGLMALPWLTAITVEWVALRWYFGEGRAAVRAGPEPASDLASPSGLDIAATSGSPPPANLPTERKRFALVVLALTLIGFGLSSVLGISPLWVAAAGAVTISLPTLAGGAAAMRQVVLAAQPGFLIFVFALGVIVRGAAQHGLSSALSDLLPGGSTPVDLILVALVSALAANVLNNLPATLLVLPLATRLGLGPTLAMLVGVNVGPNLTYGGSLATLLWRRIVHPQPVRVSLREFTVVGLLTVLPALPLASAAVWLSVKLIR